MHNVYILSRDRLSEETLSHLVGCLCALRRLDSQPAARLPARRFGSSGAPFLPLTLIRCVHSLIERISRRLSHQSL